MPAHFNALTGQFLLCEQLIPAGNKQYYDLQNGDIVFSDLLVPKRDKTLFDDATLDQRFADRKDLIDAISGQQLITFTRASAGTYVGSDGLIKTATTNEARFDHDPVTGESLGLLVEESRTNLLLQSEFQSDWSLFNTASLDPNQALAPDGLTTAALNTSTDTTDYVYSIPATTIGAQYVFSFYIKAGTSTRNHWHVRTSSTVAFGQINWSSGTIASLDVGVGSATFVDAGNGWYRVSVVYTAAETNARHRIGAGDNTSTIGTAYLWGAQLEAGSFPTSYIPTEGSTVTRAADVASITGANFSSWIDLNDGTFFSDSEVIASNVQTQIAWSLTGGTYLTSLRQPQSASNKFRAQIGNVFTPSPGTGNPLSDGTTKACVAYSGTAGRLQVGSSSNDVTLAGVLDATDLDIGSLAGGSLLNGTIRRLVYWDQRLPNDTLETITQ